MSITAPGAYVTPASPVVLQQMARLNEHADDLLVQVDQAINALQSVTIPTADLEPGWTDEELQSILNQLGPLPGYENTDWLEGLDLSSGSENFVFNPLVFQRLQEQLPEIIIPAPAAAPSLPLAPADPGDQADIPLPDRPVLVDVQSPTIDFNIPVPEYSDVSAEVPFPTLRPIDLPEPPVLSLDTITFDGTPPVFEGTAPDIADFQFTNADYQPILVDQVREKCLAMMNGQTGLPAEVEDALFERAREREVEQGERVVQQAQDEWAAKGHRLMAGPLARRVDRARNEASMKISQLNRDQFIEHWRIHIEQLRQALATSVALEEALMRMFMDAEGRRFQAARMRLDMALAIFNAMISKFNADAGVFQTFAAVYRERIQAEQAKVEVYAAELRGKQLIGELNEQDVRIFAQRLQALQVNAEIYRARVQGYAERFRAIGAQVEVYRAQLEGNKTLADIYEADIRAFGEQVRAQMTREERFNVKATIYGKQIDAWKAQYEGLLQGHTAEVETARLKRDVFVANGQRLQAFIEAESARIQSLVQKYQALAAEIGAKSEVERSRYALMLSLAQARIEQMRAAYEILLKNGEINIQSGLQAANLQLRAMETAATTLAQLAAGFTSAASINAGISDSSSSSISYNFSGELEVA